MVRVRIRPGMHHRESLVGGDVIDVTADELAAFGDKFVVIEERPEPEPEPEIEEDVDATASAIELAKEHGIDLYAIQGSGKDGRILKVDVVEAVDGSP